MGKLVLRFSSQNRSSFQHDITGYQGKPCQKSDAKMLETLDLATGGKVLKGYGCPEHEMFFGVSGDQGEGVQRFRCFMIP